MEVSANNTATTTPTMAALITIMVTAKTLGHISRNDQSLSWFQELDQELITGMEHKGNSPLFYSSFLLQNDILVYLSFLFITILIIY
jgi:hypothetical protein